MQQDLLLQPRQPGAGLQPQLLAQDLPGAPEGLQCLGLPARPVQRHHQLAPQAFPERMLGHQPFQLRGQRGVPAHGEVGLHPVLQDGQPHPLQPGPLTLQRRGVGQVGQG
jgi:hypothetical protein